MLSIHRIKKKNRNFEERSDLKRAMRLEEEITEDRKMKRESWGGVWI